MTDELLQQARRLGLKSLVWTERGDDAKKVAAAAWPYVGYGENEDEALRRLISNIEANRVYNE